MNAEAPTVSPLDALERIERQRRVVDARLSRPARWRGLLRREMDGPVDLAARARVAACFDRLVRDGERDENLDVRSLLTLHHDAVGGARFRNALAAGKVEAAIARAGDSTAVAPLTAACLYVDLLAACPFEEGNGRVARLATAWVLLRAGYRSTLFTAVEQPRPAALDGSSTIDEGVAQVLDAMAARSARAAWFRARSLQLRDALAIEGVTGPAQTRALLDWEMGRPGDPRVAVALRAIGQPWHLLTCLHANADLFEQLRRLRAEELDERPARNRGMGLPRYPLTSTTPVVASVVIPAYLAADTIAACLRGLQGQDLTEPYEVVVVASGGDATVNIVRHAFPRAVLVEAPGRLTPGAGRNLGLAQARGDVIAFLAADCIPDPSWLRRRVEAHRAGHDLVGGYVDTTKRSTGPGWAQYFSKTWGLFRYDHSSAVGRRPLFHLSYRREILLTFGAFDETPVAGEDTTYNQRLVGAGLRVNFDAAIRVRHINARRWRDVVQAHREQGAAVGALCRNGELEPRHPPTVRGALSPLGTTLRAGVAVARYKPRLFPRFLSSAPLVLLALTYRRRAFIRALRTTNGDRAPQAPSGSARRVTPLGQSAPLVSVVVAAYNEERVIGPCLDSLLAQSFDGLEILVVDDGSDDRTAEVATSRGMPVLCLPHRGPAVARNTGAAVARGRVVVFIDADLRLDPDCIGTLVEPVLAGREVGTFTRDIGVANPGVPWADCWSLRRGVPPGQYMPEGLPDRWANFRAVDRRAFLAVGGYDDVGYGEDLTLAPKLGALAAVVAGAQMYHHNPDSLGETWENAVWVGKGTRVREHPHPWRACTPWRSLRRGVRVARRSRRWRFVTFNLVYDTGVLAGLVLSRCAPRRHWK